MAEPTPEPPGQHDKSKGPEFARAFTSSVRRPHERSLLGRLTMAAVLVVVAGGVVVGVGAMANHAPSDDSERVSAEGPRDTPQAVPSSSASPSPSRTRHATHAPSAAKHHSPTASPTKHKKKQVRSHRRAGFAGVSGVLVKNAATRMCADIPNYGKGEVNGPVNQYPCTMGDADNQVWSLAALQTPKGPHGVSLFQIRNAKDELCMDLGEYGARPAGTKLAEFSCHPTTKDNQLWYLSKAPGGGHRIHNLASHGLCMGPENRAKAGAAAHLEIHPCGRGDTWSWSRG